MKLTRDQKRGSFVGFERMMLVRAMESYIEHVDRIANGHRTSESDLAALKAEEHGIEALLRGLPDGRTSQTEPSRLPPKVKADADEGNDEDTGRYSGGYRTFRDGSYREDFGSDR
jgi:hypothetical protein